MQIGFVEAALEYIKAGTLPPTALNEVVFEKEAATRLPEREDWGYLDAESSKTTAVLFRKQNFDALQSVTPEDLAASEKLEWLYFIKNGLVYKVVELRRRAQTDRIGRASAADIERLVAGFHTFIGFAASAAQALSMAAAAPANSG